MSFAEDLAVFFNPAEFADQANFAGLGAVNGIFDNAYVSSLSIGVETVGPAFLTRASDVVGLDHAAVCTIKGKNYKITGIEPDGTGLVTIQLRG